MPAIDLNTREGRIAARAAGLVVPPEEEVPIFAEADPVASEETEDERTFQARVVRQAKERGWKVYHTFDSRRSEKGFPDLTLVRNQRLIFAELKVNGRKPTKEQLDWLNALGACTASYLWTPGCWEEIKRILQ